MHDSTRVTAPDPIHGGFASIGVLSGPGRARHSDGAEHSDGSHGGDRPASSLEPDGDRCAADAHRTYEGPFDLLLQLILAEQVDIHEVSLARIVDAYLAEIERMQSLDLDVATEFLLIAATLVELKARRLLPGRADVDLDDELALWEERDLLLARLLECKTFKDVVAPVRSLADDAGAQLPPPRRAR